MICRHCFNENPEGAEVCSFCGASMMAVPEEQAVGRIYCTACGTENREDALYCESCRRLLGEAPEVPPAFRPTPHNEAMPGMAPQGVLTSKSVIDLIGETLGIYRRHLGPFLVIALASQFVAAVLVTASNVAMEAFAMVLLVMLASWGWGATVEGVSQHYLTGRVRLAACYSRALDRWLSLPIAFLILSVPTWIVPYVLAQTSLYAYGVAFVPVACFVLVRWFFFAGALMVEGELTFSSLRRSHALVGSDGWRVFGVGVAFTLVYLGASLVLSLPGLLVDSYSELAGDLLLTAAAMVTLPILWIGATLVYFDLRQRREGFDLAKLASEMGYRDKQ